ncbi:TonB-dependent receptor [uncultured Chitinophaga sp.]|jgi:Outer membrane receptor proteins, mostly Fe transport|uniref:TonB-dependent receptor n=1 Tax=uncultured Chitinophaga sp. TaxID=339340 RepID=UPI00260B3536|nr:TonB-dependent receptor [uncultured Chitinophaga sp.]
MRKLLLCIVSLLFANALFSQSSSFSGLVTDANTKFPLEGATLILMPANQTTVSNDQGRFYFKTTTAGQQELRVTAIGYEAQTVKLPALKQQPAAIALIPKNIELSEVTVSGNPADQFRPVSTLDIKMRGINNSQEVLRMVPGLFIGQHAGGGKAEQLFLRGFDLDHGTDINIMADGMPVNMVSHAHGQGYADLHFLIPELIENVAFRKGAYYPEKGNFATSGYVDFRTLNVLPDNLAKLEGGMFNTFRGLGMVNLLGERAKQKQQSAFIATEYMYTGGYFDHPQNFNRFNLFGKYHGKLNESNILTFTAATFYSKWNASGQIPDRAVESGLIGWFGAIDPNEGGITSRTNVNAALTTSFSNGDVLKNQLYFSRYNFELYSNFTFFKEDPVNGDQIRQREHRNMFGYNGSYTKISFLGNIRLRSEVGTNLRLDRTQGSELSRTKDRTNITDAIQLGDISESNLAAYISEAFQFTERFTMSTGLRYDHFFDQYTDRLRNDTIGKANAGILSPKLNFYYHLNNRTQFYLTTGKGFHSNDTRVVVPQNGLQVLPAAYGTDLGTVWKPVKDLLLNAAVWYLWLDQEFVYVGDEGVVAPSGKSRRTGFDISARFQPVSWLYLDADLNYANGRAVKEPKGQNYLPLAPVITSAGGVTVKTKPGISGSLRYRYMGNRPANEDNTVVAKGYFVTDAFINFTRPRYELGLTAQNLFDVRWKETQFDTESRLQHEAAPVSEIHFTPGTPFFLKISASYLF